MKLLYFRGNQPNLGDDLNALLWPRIAPALFERSDGDGFLGIGTVIGMIANDVAGLHVFSSGVGYAPVDHAMVARSRFWCVRGPLSAHVLGLDPSVALTDGAILTPAILPAPTVPRRGVVVMPHWETMLAEASQHRWRTACALAGMTLVNPMDAPAASIASIAGASLVLTEALHGAIIADTYGVPWIAFATNANFSVFKWLDWARSVGVTLRVHAVRPPDTAALVRFGRHRICAWGGCAEPDEAAIMADFSRRTWENGESVPDTAERMKTRMKRQVERSPRLQSLLGYSPSATAAALTRLAKAEPSLSGDSMRAQLTERMTERLDALVREQTAARALLTG